MRALYCFIFIIFIQLPLSSQVEILGAFSQDSIVIGDEVEFTVSIEVQQDVEILGVGAYFLDSIYSALQSAKMNPDTSQPVKPAIADFELISSGGWVDSNNDGIFAGDELKWNTTAVGSQRILESTFSIRLWDPGNNIVLYPTVIYLQNGVQDQFNKSGQMIVFVAPPGGLPASQDSIQVAPIKNIKEETANFSDYIFYFLIIGLALILGLGYYLYSKYYKNRKDEIIISSEPEIYVPPHEVALEKLTALSAKELWQHGKIKKYQTELTHIIREYLEGRYEIAALESTTDEIVQSLIRGEISDQDVISLRKILQVADLVKFAKAKPDENVHETFMNEAVDFVERTREVQDQEEVND